MAKSTLGVIVALSMSLFSATSIFASETRLPLAKDGEIPTPSVLADRIQKSLKSDPSGNKILEGANGAPTLFLEAIHALQPNVDTYPELDTYLRSLKEGAMPDGILRLSEIDLVGNKPVLDLKTGSHRYAKPGERGWYDGRNFVVAGNCMNTELPLKINITSPISVGQKFVDPYAGKPREVKTTSCPLGDHGRYVAVHMFEPKTAQHACAVAHMLPQDGNLGEAKKGQSTKDWSNPDAFSRKCGQVIHEAGYKFATKAHAVQIAVVNGDEKHVFFTGSLKGNTFTADADSEALIAKNGEAVLVPKAFDKGHVVAFFSDQSKVRTPAPSGVGENIANIKEGCAVTVLTAIEMP